jgi:hypothetical protein
MNVTEVTEITSTVDYSYPYYYDYDNVTLNNSHLDFTDTFAFKVGDFMSHYYTPAVVFVGSVGNILSVIVFFKTKLRKLSSSYYLAALAISDTCFLLGTFVSWLNYVNIDIYNQNFYCQFFTYTSGLCSFLSVWFVVGFTVERFIAVLYPLRRQTMCTVKRACTILGVLFVIGALVSVPLFVFASPKFSEYINDYICDVVDEYKVSLNCEISLKIELKIVFGLRMFLDIKEPS